MSKITLRDTKQEIWNAYQSLIKKIKQEQKQEQEKEKSMATDEASGVSVKSQEIIKEPTKKEFVVEQVVSEITDLKTNTNNLLNRLADRLVAEIENLNLVKFQVVEENKNLEKIYGIKAEADILIRLLETQNRQKEEFDKNMAEEKEGLCNDIETKKKKWTQAEEEYEYDLQVRRKRENNEYQIKKEEKERDLLERERIMKDKENYLKELEQKTSNFPKEIEEAVERTRHKTKVKMEHDYRIRTSLRDKEVDKERALAQMRISNMDSMIQKQQAQIQALEKQLEAAVQKAQELAVKIVESRKEKEEAKLSESYNRDASHSIQQRKD